MKYFFLPLLLMLSQAVAAQDLASNFRLTQGKVVYENIFHNEELTDLKESLTRRLYATGGITNIQDQGQYLTADINEMIIDFRKYGATRLDVSYPLYKAIRGKLMIEFREGRYKANISDIVFFDNPPGKDACEYLLEEVFVRNTRQEFRSRPTIKLSLRIMDMQFKDIFTIKEDQQVAKDW